MENHTPYSTFIEYNEILLEPQDKYESYCKLAIPPRDLKEICADLKVLGRRDMKVLVKWRTKIMKRLEKDKIEEA